MRRSLATIAAALLGLALLTPGAAQAAPAAGKPTGGGEDLTPAQRTAITTGIGLAPKAKPGTKPKGPNPFLAQVPDATKVDYAGWTAYLKSQAKAKAALRSATLKATDPALATLAAAPAVVVDEDEFDGTSGANDRPALAQRVPYFGTATGQYPKIRVLGSLDHETVNPTSIGAPPEDDGAIPLAGETGVGTTLKGVRIQSQIGDGPHGRQTGDGSNDFDFYKVDAVPGKVLTFTTATPASSLDTVLLLYRADGTLVTWNDDYSFPDSRILHRVTTAETLYLAVAAYRGLPGDPFDSASGDGIGDASPPGEGTYDLTITSAAIDRDVFALPLRAGDVLGATVTGSPADLTVYDTEPKVAQGSDQDLSFIFPMASPLPAGGNAVTDYVATKTGLHYVEVANGAGAYDITVEGYRPPLEGSGVQTLYLDFDGARVNTGLFGGPGNRNLSPLAAFLSSWGLTRVDEEALIDTVVATVRENLEQDLAASGLNERFQLKVTNSKDDEDSFGQDDVSRIVVGGTIAESGVDTIGVAQSIDPGNFETEETAMVLLDVLSSPGDDWNDSSINSYLTDDSDRVAFVGHALGNVIAHEAGHLLGNWHTDNLDGVANLMDAGGESPELMFGVGPDGIGGTADDTDTDFATTGFQPSEGFAGTEDTLGRAVFGATS
jgi:hypothetical protein